MEKRIRHFADNEFVNRSRWLTDPEMEVFLDCIIGTCTDVFVVSEGKLGEVFLGRRRDKPAQGQLWVQGGRWRVGLTSEENVRNILKTEIGLEIVELERIINTGFSFSYIWENRHQPPEGHGCHMVGHYHYVVISQEEREMLNRLQSNKSFSEFAWMPLDDIYKNESFHQGMRESARSVRNYYYMSRDDV